MSAQTSASTDQKLVVSEPAPPNPPERKNRARNNQLSAFWKRFINPILVFVALLVIWHLVTKQNTVSPLLLPPPSEVWSSLSIGLFNGLWWPHIGTTLFEMVAGFTIGVIAGLVIGAIFAFLGSLYQAFYPLVIAIQSLPKVAIAPLLIVAIGYGPEPKIIIAALMAYFPVMSAAIAGFTNVNPDEFKLMRATRANKLQELRYLRLPNAMSYVFPALDVAVVMALLGAVAAELVGAQQGLGYLLVERQSYGDSASMYGVLILLSILGLTLKSLAQGIRTILPQSIAPR